MKTSRCSGCGLHLPTIDGPVHRYMESSPACWAKYGELLAREYENPEYMAVHRLTVDTYAVQHPGTPSPQSIQSVAVHLISMYVVLERSMDQKRATALIQVGADKGSFVWLTPPALPYRINVLHPLNAENAFEHAAAVPEWAQCTWRSWAAHHTQVRAWAAAFSDA